MKVERKDGKVAKRILTAMIVEKEVLSKIAPKWNSKEGNFDSEYSNIIGNFCVKHYNKYGDAPGKTIQSIFDSWSSNGGATKKEVVPIIERFLNNLSEEYEELSEGINVEHTVDTAAQHFNQVQAERLASAVEGDIARGKTAEAIKRIKSFTEIEIGSSAVINVMQDQNAMKAAFEQKEESIIKYPGPLGEFFGNALEREGFIAFMAPDKTGKSIWLMDLAFRAMTQRRRVAFFEVGDMTERQIMRRIGVRAACRPRKPRMVRYPTGIFHDPDSRFAEVQFEEREFKKALTWQQASDACNKILKKKVKSKTAYWRMMCYPNSTASMRDIKAVVDQWCQDDWVPDVVIIDYADILAPMHSTDEGREQINKTWKAMRALSQSTHCLVATATQSSAKGYSANILTRKEFSDDKRKMAHVTAMIGINVSEEEKENGQSRLNWIVLRDDEFVTTKCIHLAGCIPLMNPAIKSTF
jgi:hypothetical protein